MIENADASCTIELKADMEMIAKMQTNTSFLKNTLENYYELQRQIAILQDTIKQKEAEIERLSNELKGKDSNMTALKKYYETKFAEQQKEIEQIKKSRRGQDELLDADDLLED